MDKDDVLALAKEAGFHEFEPGRFAIMTPVSGVELTAQLLKFAELLAAKQQEPDGITVWRIAEPSHPYPWRFTVTQAGKVHRFAGIQNKCETMEEAYQRAAERYGWMLDGTYDQRYAAPVQAQPVSESSQS